ncbi:MAG: T9SS type A sorting domain-containing protein [Bacteroidia bacterium]
MRKLLLFLVGIYPGWTTLSAQTMILHPSIETMGVEVTLPAGYDNDRSSKCLIYYKPAGSAQWLEGLPADRINFAGQDEFRGSLFNLDAATPYEVQVTLQDSIPVISSQSLPVQTISTRSEITITPMGNIKWVSPVGTANAAYSQTDPGNIAALFAEGISCGTTIMVMDGIYDVEGLQLTISENCTENTPIILMAAPGARPVFDGAYRTKLEFAQLPTDAKMFYAELPIGTGYTNLCIVDSVMLYPYPSVSPNNLVGNYSLSALDFNYDGFVRDQSLIYIKTAEGTNPNNVSVTISKGFRFLTVYGGGKNAWLRIKGLTIKNYCNAYVNGATVFTAMGLDIRAASQIVIDSCVFAYNNTPMYFTGKSNFLTIQNCRFEDQTGLWSHGMIKKSVSDQTFFVPTSLGRQLENAAIVIAPGWPTEGIIIKNNHFSGINSGIISNGVASIPSEVDIYENTFVQNFDAIETDGDWCNLRVWKNQISRCLAGFSNAPPEIGPRYFYRNTVYDIISRQNVQNDPYYVGCAPPTTYFSQGLGIKTNFGGSINPNPSAMYFINNTFHTADALGFMMYQWDSEWKKLYSINNIFYSSGDNLFFQTNALNNPDYQFRSDHDNYYINGNKPIWTYKEEHGQYDCHYILKTIDLDPEISAITGSPKVSFNISYQKDPEFISAANGNFNLKPYSPVIDAGVAVKGFYDFEGPRPDLGAWEYPYASSIHADQQRVSLNIYPNPSEGPFFLETEYTLESVRVYNSLGQEVRVMTEILPGRQKAEITVMDQAGVFYIVAETSSGPISGKVVVVDK